MSRERVCETISGERQQKMKKWDSTIIGPSYPLGVCERQVRLGVLQPYRSRGDTSGCLMLLPEYLRL